MSSDTTTTRPLMVQAVSSIWLAMATLCVVIRLIGRFVFLKSGGLDDIAITISWAASVVNVVLGFIEVKYGMGKQIVDVAPADLMKATEKEKGRDRSSSLRCLLSPGLAQHGNSLLPQDITLTRSSTVCTSPSPARDEIELRGFKYLWIAAIFYNISLTFVKISIILQYLRFFVGSGIRLLAWMLLAFVVMCGIQVFFTSVFTCIPVSAFWGATRGRCINQVVVQFFNAGLNILTDILILALPVRVVWGLHLPHRQKVGLMFVFGLGGFVCLVSILRLHALYIMTTSSNITYDSAVVMTWSIVSHTPPRISNILIGTRASYVTWGQTWLTIRTVCASLPAMRPFVSRLFPRFLATTYATQQPPVSSQGRFRSIPDSTVYSGKSIQLTSIESSNRMNKAACEKKPGKRSKDVYVTTMTTQDVECIGDPACDTSLVDKRPGRC
ncbi:unnamed protein product [Diplocarpon coronariae]|nr:PTH11-like integral membrane protein [Diplocarpon mali]